jgi:hypothetical protein
MKNAVKRYVHKPVCLFFLQILLATDYSDCQPCPVDTFNDLEGQTYCRPCGSSSYAPAGSAACTCEGQYRYFQPSYGACVCLSGYVYYDEVDTKVNLDAFEGLTLYLLCSSTIALQFIFANQHIIYTVKPGK